MPGLAHAPHPVPGTEPPAGGATTASAQGAVPAVTAASQTTQQRRCPSPHGQRAAGTELGLRRGIVRRGLPSPRKHPLPLSAARIYPVLSSPDIPRGTNFFLIFIFQVELLFMSYLLVRRGG